MAESEEPRSVGVEITCSPDAADDILQVLREAVEKIIEEYGADVVDYGVG